MKQSSIRTLPEQPPRQTWPFERLLSLPVHEPAHFGSGSRPLPGELEFGRGIRLLAEFPDPGGLLKTAYDDFHAFCASIRLGDSGPCPIRIIRVPSTVFESYRIAVRSDGIAISSGDTEGIRRGLIDLETMILARGQHALTLGATARKPWIRTRLSRCFYGPINRPPLCRNELDDDADYYPDNYLNRLAHHGINALWLTVTFRDLCPSKILPGYGADAGRRLDKLRDVVRRCARYGIRIYPFCIEPAALPADSPVFKTHPELRGADAAGGRALFCTSSPTGQAYVEEATHTLFSQVPGLGGLLCIPVGERFTHCYSGSTTINCPRCSGKKPETVLAELLAAMQRGMHAAAPGAELIAWPYSQPICWGIEPTVRSAGHMPSGVVLQHNYESGGRVRQLGQWRPLWDYWLSWVGPSPIFAGCARSARARGTPVFAKLQAGCSHEVATTQSVPVPGILFRKFAGMRRLGVSGAMLGWYFGNYPSVMTRAAGRLAFTPFPASEPAFLRELAWPVWGQRAAVVARAWRHFQNGYLQYPGFKMFGYYGPMHDGPVWPLYLKPRGEPLAPTWRTVHPPSSDAIAECCAPTFRPREALTLCRRMRGHWRRGLAILRPLRHATGLTAVNREELTVAEALGLHIESTCNILAFYLLRDRLATARNPRRCRGLLTDLRRIVRDEIDHDRELLELCRQNPTLGFHAEAEGYKYHPARIRWRMRQLDTLLHTEFPEAERRPSETFFGDYLGKGSRAIIQPCPRHAGRLAWGTAPDAPEWDALPAAACRHWSSTRPADAGRPFPFNSTLHPLPPRRAPGSSLAWRIVADDDALYIRLDYGPPPPCPEGVAAPEREETRIVIQTVPLAGYAAFVLDGDGHLAASGAVAGREGRDWSATVTGSGEGSRACIRLAAAAIGLPRKRQPTRRPRINVVRWFSPIGDPLRVETVSRQNTWAPARTALPRNVFGYIHPGQFGFLAPCRPFEGPAPA